MWWTTVKKDIEQFKFDYSRNQFLMQQKPSMITWKSVPKYFLDKYWSSHWPHSWSLDAFKVVLPGRRLFWTISSLLGDLAQLHAHENASNPLHQGSSDKTFKKCGLSGHKAVNGSRNLMLSSIISKMCVAFNELYSLSEPKISHECFSWHYVAIYVNDNFWILMTEKERVTD